MEKSIFYAIIVIMLFGQFLEIFLDHLNHKTWKEHLPQRLDGFYTEEEYRKARNYHHENYRFGLISNTLFFLVTFIFFVAGGFGKLSDWLASYTPDPIIHSLLFFAVLYFASDMLHIPFRIYDTFVIEEKFGFNKMTVKTFILDKIKTYLLAVVIGGLVITALLWIILQTGDFFWLVAFAFLLVVSLFFSVFYTSLFLPLFNKLTPLEDGELKEKITNYAQKVKFPLQHIFVMDGSKRSSKANAFFSGLWKKKKIVLFDTLIKKHSIDELVAVLAHEVGHYKKKHIVKGIFLSSLQTFIMLFILSLFIFNPDLTAAMGSKASTAVIHLSLIAFAVLFEPVSLLLGLVGNYYSRKNEFEADRYAVLTTESTGLSDALRKMSVDHLSNLHPHPSYVFFYYSHPPLIQRLEAIEKIIRQNDSKV